MNAAANPLKDFVCGHFGNHRRLALALQMSTSTITHWTSGQPRNILKYAPEILRAAPEASYAELESAVLARLKQIDGA